MKNGLKFVGEFSGVTYLRDKDGVFFVWETRQAPHHGSLDDLNDFVSTALSELSEASYVLSVDEEYGETYARLEVTGYRKAKASDSPGISSAIQQREHENWLKLNRERQEYERLKAKFAGD